MFSSPPIIAHSVAHKDPLNNIAVEEFIKRVILPRRQINDPDPNVVSAKLVDNFWTERDDFVKNVDSSVGRAFGLLQGTQ